MAQSFIIIIFITIINHSHQLPWLVVHYSLRNDVCYVHFCPQEEIHVNGAVEGGGIDSLSALLALALALALVNGSFGTSRPSQSGLLDKTKTTEQHDSRL